MTAVKLRLKEILQEKNISQKELSAMTGLSENSISRLTIGVTSIRMDSIDAICTALNIQPGELISYKKNRS